jgi:3-dehydroquinate synthetase
VGLGLLAEAALAAGLGLATPEAGARVAALLEGLGLPTRVGEPVDEARLVGAMASDKKNRARGIRFALPRDIGTMAGGPEWTTPAGEPAIRAALRAIL